MSTFKLSGRGAIKIGVFRPIVRFTSKNVRLWDRQYRHTCRPNVMSSPA